MTVQSLIKRYFVYAVVLIAGILIGVQLMGVAAAPPPDESVPPQAGDLQANPKEPSQINTNYLCTIADVVTWINRVHVRCTAADANGIQYFAAPTSDYKHAARILSHLLTAQATGNQVGVEYDLSDASGIAYGCQDTDCRPILALVTVSGP